MVHPVADEVEDPSPLQSILGRPVIIETNDDGRADKSPLPAGAGILGAVIPSPRPEEEAASEPGFPLRATSSRGAPGPETRFPPAPGTGNGRSLPLPLGYRRVPVIRL